MQSIFTQFSGLVGLLVFLHQLWDYAPVERAVVLAAGSGMAVYLVLLIGHAAIRHIVEYRPPQLAEETAGGSGSEDASSARSSSKPAPADESADAPAS